VPERFVHFSRLNEQQCLNSSGIQFVVGPLFRLAILAFCCRNHKAPSYLADELHWTDKAESRHLAYATLICTLYYYYYYIVFLAWLSEVLVRLHILQMYPGAYHQIHNEWKGQGDEAVSDVVKWITDVISA